MLKDVPAGAVCGSRSKGPVMTPWDLYRPKHKLMTLYLHSYTQIPSLIWHITHVNTTNIFIIESDDVNDIEGFESWKKDQESYNFDKGSGFK